MSEKPKYFDTGYYETNPEALETGRPGIPPQLDFEPTTPLVEQMLREASFVGVRFYLHPKLGNTYRYKYRWKGEPWWLDVTFDRDGYHLWKGDGQAFMETREDAEEARAPKPAQAAGES